MTLSLLVIVLLANCVKVTSSSPVCGLYIDYTPAFQKQVAADITGLEGEGLTPSLVKLVDDYSKTRESIKQCKKGK